MILQSVSVLGIRFRKARLKAIGYRKKAEAEAEAEEEEEAGGERQRAKEGRSGSCRRGARL